MLKKHWLIATAVLLFLTAPSLAQEYPRVELFGGYSALVAGDLNDLDHANGVGAEFAGNFNRFLGLVAEFGVHRDNDLRIYSAYAGPRLSFRGRRVTFFIHALAGGVRAPNGGGSLTVASFAGGGGLDLNVSDNVAIRLFQIDYTPVRQGGHWFNLYRGQTGVTFKLGRTE
ncbi:MAG: hypothetical protein AB7U82_16310 [Blastocatellales bacterium]